MAPSSRHLARRMVDIMPWGEGERIVEFGPGTGALTGEVLARLPEGARYLGIELEPAFVDRLRERFPGAEFVADSVTRLRDIVKDVLLPN